MHVYRMTQLELQSKQSDAMTVRSAPSNYVETKSLKIPYVKETDDIEVYLSTFERITNVSKWGPDTWAARLATLLTGKAREAYVRMSITYASKYD